jgi:hypothetical protein
MWVEYLIYCLLVIGIILVAVLYAAMAPANNRSWRADHAVLSFAKRDGDVVHVYNVHNFAYRSLDDFDARYYDATYNLSELESVEYLIEPFSRWKGLSHTMLTFGFRDGRHLVVSAEARKEEGETFNALSGVMRKYELIYVLGDEQDTIKRRTNFENDEVMLYPLNLTPEQQRALLLSVLERANRLREKPEFYNTFMNSCTTNLIDHLNAIAARKIPYSYRIVFPGYSAAALRDAGLIDATLPLDDRRFKIRKTALRYADDPLFSQRIRAPVNGAANGTA